jgi:NADH-quinone oxidoreductase subunit N
MIYPNELLLAAPLIFIASGILLLLIIDMFFPKPVKLVSWLALIILFSTGYLSYFSMRSSGLIFNKMFLAGGISNFYFFVFNIAGAVVVLFSIDYLRKIEIDLSEFYILLLSSVLGMMIIAGARDLIIVFIGLEQMSICFYILAGLRRKNELSNESAIKYFLLGSFATGFIVYGMALIYGSAHSLHINEIAVGIKLMNLLSNPFFLTGFVLFTIGFMFKIAAFPFHSWAPDVYEGAPTNVTSLMSTAGKTAAFAALIIAFTPIISIFNNQNLFTGFIAILASASMIYGAFSAIVQENIKRLLAYSSIAHAGYMLIGLSVGSGPAIASVLYYLLAYTFMNLGAFGVIILLESRSGKFLKMNEYADLGSRSPVLAAMLSLFMFALSGLPPFAGFFGKYFVFVQAIYAKQTWLAIIGVLSSVISAYFYLRIIVIMYFGKQVSGETIEYSQIGMIGVIISALFVLLLGITANAVLNLILSTM